MDPALTTPGSPAPDDRDMKPAAPPPDRLLKEATSKELIDALGEKSDACIVAVSGLTANDAEGDADSYISLHGNRYTTFGLVAEIVHRLRSQYASHVDEVLSLLGFRR